MVGVFLGPCYLSLGRCFAENRSGRMVLAAPNLHLLSVTSEAGTIAFIHLLSGICCYFTLDQLFKRTEIEYKSKMKFIKIAPMSMSPPQQKVHW